MRNYKIGVDIGGTKIAYGLFDEDNSIVAKMKTPTNPNIFPEELVKVVTQDIRALAEQNAVPISSIKGIGLGFPSYVVFDKGFIAFTTNMHNMRDFYAADAFKKEFPDTRIIIDNDTNLAAIAEHRHGAGKGFEHMVYTAVSTGVGSGFIINNQIFRGSYGGAGESGHMLITPDEGVMCGCGNKGCFMSYTSGSMIKRHIINRIKSGDKSVMSDMVRDDLDQITAEHLNTAFQQGDGLAVRMVDQIGYYLGVYIYNTFIQLNINCYVFGGGMVNFGAPLFDRIRQTVDRFSHCQEDQKIYYKTAQLGNDFGIIGAAELLN